MSEANVALPSMRVSYEAGALHEDSLAGTWHEQLQLWFDEAVAAELVEPNAMVLPGIGARRFFGGGRAWPAGLAMTFVLGWYAALVCQAAVVSWA